ncbi:MAG: S-layer homology domain-containing protein [Ruminococcus bromii]|nr:S-layer homology domain-containing protein [Ruminococcus bromii]
MLSEDVLAQTQFGAKNQTRFDKSAAQTWCNDFKSKALTATEQLAVFTTVSKQESSQTINDNIYSYNNPSNLLPRAGSAVFFLSATEASNSAYGFSSNDARRATSGAWWLISRATTKAGTFGTVSSDGAFQSTAANSPAGARPALNLDKRQVLFTTAADNSAHQDGLVTPTSYDGHEFKLTLKDAKSFADGAKIIGGRTTLNNQYQDASITIQHKALKDISDTYTNVTAALTDSKGTLLYYGSVNSDPGAMRTGVTLPNGLSDGTYTLSLYGEDWNDEYKSDYATGTPFTVKITIHDGADSPDLTPREQDGLLTIDKITGYDAKWGYNYLYFGKFGADPILWRVLSASGNATGDTDSLKQGEDTVSNDDAMFLLSEYLLGQGSGIVFNANGTAYQGSAAQTWCGALLTDFTENEQNVVLATVKSDAASTNDRNLQFPAVENILNRDKVFLPSVEEMKNAKYGFLSENDLIAYYGGSTAENWWMRSAGTGASIADAEYNTNRTEYKIYTKLANEHSYARPAFNLSKNNVLFVCTADGVKIGAVGSTLTEIESNLSSKWKLTLLDKSRNFSVTGTEVEKFAGGTLTLHYTGAQTGSNEYISAIFYDADGKAAYYGRLKNLTDGADAEGSVALTVPAGLGEGEYKLVLFNEQYNGAKQTDYASSFCTVSLTVDNTAPVLSGFAVSRASDSTATVDFTASESGAYYYAVDNNETISSIDTTTSNRIAMITGEQTLELDNISAGKSYLHIVAEDVAGNMCEVQTIQILGFLPAPTNADWDDAVLGKASWGAVEHASGYSIQLYKDGTALGSAETVTETNYTFTIPEPPAEDSNDSTTTTPTLPDNAITKAGTYSFRVTALGNGTDYSNSVAAESARHLSSITVEENENGTITASARYAVSGTEITLTGNPNSGYRFSKWSLTPELTVTDNKFTMPEGAVTVSAVFARRSSSSTYPITVKDSKNGSASSSHKSASSGTTVTITVMPDKGYTLETLTVTDKNGKYTFTMPASKVEINATFMDDNAMLNYFVDVKANDYFYDAVLWAAQNGITSGTDAVHFTPDGVCSRAQAVTFLWRAAGSPAPKSVSMPFTDVPKGSYYETAVLWAVENGITKGTSDTTFSPDATCSRAQIVTFLWRSQKSPAVGSLNPFTDVSANAYYTDAVLWAVEENITKGTTATTFSPDTDCSRAQIVTLLYRAYVK